MKKWLKLLGMVITVTILILIIAVISIVTFVSPNRLKPILTAKVMQHTGRQLTIDGNLSWSFFPSLGVKTGHMELGNPTGFQQPLFAEIQEAHIDVKFLPLLRNRIESNSVTLHGLKLYLIKNAKGQANWTFSSKDAKTESNAATTSLVTSLPTSALSLAIAGVEVSDGQVMWLDEQTKQSAIINHFDLHAKNIGFLQPFPVVMRFEFVNAAASGQVKLNSDISVNMGTQLYSLRSLELVADVQQAEKKFNLKTTGDVIADLQQQTLQCHNFRVAIEDLVLTGKIGVTHLMTSPLTTGQLHIEPFDLRAWLKNIGQDVTNIQTFKTVSGDIDISTVNDAINILGKLSVDEIEANHVKLSQVNIPLHFQNNVLNLSPITANFYQGTLQTNTTVDLQMEQPKIAVDGKLVNIQAGPLLDDLGSAKKKLKFSGTANVDMQITTAGLEAASIVKNLNGVSHLSVVNGTLEGIDIRYYIELAKAFLARRPSTATNTNKTEFINLTASTLIKNGVVQNDDLQITSSLFTTKGKGVINLINQSIDYHTYTFINKTSAMEDTGWADISKVSIPILVYGNLNDPTIRLDSGELTKSVADTVIQKTKEDLKEKIQKKIGDQGGALLQNLLGH
jgi:AsmA protein